jgi:hypothetical protein
MHSGAEAAKNIKKQSYEMHNLAPKLSNGHPIGIEISLFEHAFYLYSKLL